MRYTILLFSSLILFASCTDSTTKESNSSEKTNVNIQQNPDTPTDNKSVENNHSEDIVAGEDIIEGEVSSVLIPDGNTSSNKENTTDQVSIKEEQSINNVAEEAEEIISFHEYVAYNSFLKKHVSSKGNVDYKGIKTDISTLNLIIEELENNYPESSWSKNQQLAYWINAYNIFTIKLIVDNYPVSSIKDITAKPWHKKFIQLGGNTYSLNAIENDIIRVQFNEPRIHFALNCASVSCPILMNSAFRASSLNYQLTKQTKKFLADNTKNTFTETAVTISPVFDWYNSDFTKNGTLIDFLNTYRTEPLSTPTISYKEYDWGLNK